MFLPCVCDSCGITFPARSPIGGSGGFVQLTNVKIGPCPNCGCVGTVQDGLYELMSDALRLISASTQSRQQIERLAELLRQSQHDRTMPDQVAERIATETPEMAGFAAWVRQYLVPKNAGEFWQFIGVILAAIPLLMLAMQDQKPDEKMVKAIAEKAVEAALAKNQKAPQAQPTAPPRATNSVHQAKKRKIGRNDPCPCNSGKKYKICCINKISGAAPH